MIEESYIEKKSFIFFAFVDKKKYYQNLTSFDFRILNVIGRKIKFYIKNINKKK